MPRCIGQNDAQQPSQATSHILFMLGRKVTCGVRVHHPQHVVGARCCAEQQHPRALQIRDVRNPVQEHLVFGGNDTQLSFHELSVPQRRPQHFHSLLVSGECVIASPHDCCGVHAPGSFSQQMASGEVRFRLYCRVASFLDGLRCGE